MSKEIDTPRIIYVNQAPGTEDCTPEQEDMKKTTQSESMETKKKCQEMERVENTFEPEKRDLFNTVPLPAWITNSLILIAFILIGLLIGVISIGALAYTKTSRLEQEIIDLKINFSLNIDYINKTKVTQDELNVQEKNLDKLITATSDLKKKFTDLKAHTAQLISQTSLPENFSEYVHYENFSDQFVSVNSVWNKNFDALNASNYYQNLEITFIQGQVAFLADLTQFLNSSTVEIWNNMHLLRSEIENGTTILTNLTKIIFEQLPRVLNELGANVRDVRAQQTIFANLLEQLKTEKSQLTLTLEILEERVTAIEESQTLHDRRLQKLEGYHSSGTWTTQSSFIIVLLPFLCIFF